MAILTFELEIERSLSVDQLAWVSDEEAEEESGLGGNHHYVDLRDASWDQVRETVALERDVLARIAGEESAGVAYAAYRDEIYDDPDNPLALLDLGVAASVYALSAAGCIPFSSCNGGALEDHFHKEAFPLVACYLRAELSDIVLECAEAAGVGVKQNEYGEVVIYASELSHLIDFGAALFDSRDRIDRTREAWQEEVAGDPQHNR